MFEWSRKTFEIRGWRLRICKFFEIIRKNFSNWKVRTIFDNRMRFLLFLGGFSYLINQNNYNSNCKKMLRFRNLQEKLEKVVEHENAFCTYLSQLSLLIALWSFIKQLFPELLFKTLLWCKLSEKSHHKSSSRLNTVFHKFSYLQSFV